MPQHRVPLDRYRLVMPPALLAVLAGAVYAAFRVLIPIESGIITHEAWHALYGSGLLGYGACSTERCVRGNVV